MNQILWALVAQTGVIVAGCVVIILHNNARFSAIDKRIDDLRSEMNHRFDDLKDWIRSEVRRLEERIEHVERPVLKG
ncbi:MAG TPA: hypothetical protein VMT20_25005 [Terriglobia bacterium]|nr:hypothetical protein [Terriglobia bacterium]